MTKKSVLPSLYRLIGPIMKRGAATIPQAAPADKTLIREETVVKIGTNACDHSDSRQPGAQHPARRMDSVRRIDRIAQHIGAQSYLEIGVSRGATFNRVTLNTKVGVDPHFRFETEKYRNERTELHALTSDRYFTEVAGSRKFDIIFLDGLHQFHQTFRDFCNSLVFSHDRTVWLIDDVFPVDVYSSLPIQQESLKFRRRMRDGSNPEWHGDVYKVIFAIHDFFPMMSFVTLMGGGNPQTIAWKTPRKKFTPVFNSMEKIERLGYFDMLNHENVLNGKSEQDAFDFFFASLPGVCSASPSPAGVGL